jgi:hypothetical protein
MRPLVVLIIALAAVLLALAADSHGIGKHGIDTSREITAGPEGLTAEAVNTKRTGPHR